MQIQENVLLKNYTTFRLGGPARYFVDCVDEQDVVEGLIFARKHNVPFFVLGGGSNTVFSDEGFPGVVLHMSIKGMQVLQGIHDEALVLAGAGEQWDEFVEFTLSENLSGIENLSHIPGTVGAAPVQNIGAYGVEVGDFIEEVTVFDTKENKKKSFLKNDCRFGYRTSVFKEVEGRYIILSIVFRLDKKFKPVLSYADVKKAFWWRKPSAMSVRKKIIKIRNVKLPDWKLLPTAGSFFKNPELAKEEVDALTAKFPDVPVYPHGEKFKVSAGYLIEHCARMKGERRGHVGVYDKHALVLVNYGEGTFKELDALVKEIQEKVKTKTGVELEPEVNVI